jgi:hypothetical protein
VQKRLIVLITAGLTVLALAELRSLRDAMPGPGESEDGGLGWWDTLSGAALPRYEIEVDPQLHAELLAQASGDEAYRRWVPARFATGGASYEAEVRIDAVRDGEGAASVWRLHFHGKQRYRGMADLTLSPARGEAETGEVVASRLARDLGLLALPAGFARLAVNGNDAGVVLWSDAHSRQTLLRLGYVPGPVFEIATEPTADVAEQVRRVAPARKAFSRVDPDPPDAAARKLARLLELARNGGDAEFARAVPQLLNVDKYIAWNALAWLYGSPSADQGPGVRWYYDPVTGLFEPFLASLGRHAVSIPDESLAAAHRSPVGARLFAIDRYREERNRILWSLLNDPAFDLARAGRRDLRSLQLHLAGGPGASGADVTAPTRSMSAVLAHNAERLRVILADSARQARGAGPTAALARFWSTVRGPLALTVAASGPVNPLTGFGGPSMPIRAADALGWGWPGPAGLLALSPTLGADPTVRLAVVEAAPFRVRASALAPERRGADPIADSGLPFVERGDAWVLPAGRYTLSRTLVVPADHRLVLAPGVSLQLGPGVSIVTFRALTARGTAAEPIRIGRADPDRPWGAIGVVRAPEPSRLEHVAAAGGSHSVVDGIDLAGQFAFNASDVEARDCDFRHATHGEGLSVRRASFDIERTRLIDNGLDGLDVEWTRGRVRDSEFFGNGDDGIDLASSQVQIQGSSFRGMRDKAVSAGEGSALRIADSEISSSKIGLASKEGSRVEVVRSEVIDNEVGFSLYRGKVPFAGGRGLVRGGRFSGNRRDIEIEPGSDLEFADPDDEFASALDAVGRWFARPRTIGSAAD